MQYIELLLERGASIKAMNKDHHTLLHLAAQKNHTHIVQLLKNKAVELEHDNIV